jgi:hypothetical protein
VTSRLRRKVGTRGLHGLGLAPVDVGIEAVKSVRIVGRVTLRSPRRVSGRANLGRDTNWLVVNPIARTT